MSILTGIFLPPLQLFSKWQDSAYFEELKKEFEKLHNLNKNSCLSEVGTLVLSGEDTLIPRYVMRQKDNSIKEIACHTEPIALSDLIHDKEKIEEIKKEGYLVVVKYDNER